MTDTPDAGTPTRPRTPWREARPPGPTNPDPNTPPAEVFFAVGRIVGAHGIRGEAKMEIFTDDPDHLLDLRRVYFDDDPTPRRLSGVRFHARQALLTFPDITDRDAADALRGTIVRISGSQAKPPNEGEFYHYQLIGLAVQDEAGNPLGTLTEILEAGEVDTYVVRNEDGREQLFPALKDVVLDINPAENRVVVRPLIWEADTPRKPHNPDRPPRPRKLRRPKAGPSTT
ncbi:MAG TPA: ribosome maturation factor RimM [Thermomicrobiales bacterium]|nr:ribosome maturation factor RimM [Thermomicrobiales bacterium]